MSLALRLQRVQQKVQVEMPHLDNLSLHQLESQVIDFGKTHVGKTYQEVWEKEQPWVTWFVQHFPNSTKKNHRAFLYYVNLKVERAELTGEPVMVGPSETDLVANLSTTGKESGKSLPKAKAKAMEARPKAYPKTEHALEFEDLIQEDPELDETDLFEMVGAPQPDVSHLEQRMLHLETALTRVIQHLESQVPKTTESAGAWTRVIRTMINCWRWLEI